MFGISHHDLMFTVEGAGADAATECPDPTVDAARRKVLAENASATPRRRRAARARSAADDGSNSATVPTGASDQSDANVSMVPCSPPPATSTPDHGGDGDSAGVASDQSDANVSMVPCSPPPATSTPDHGGDEVALVNKDNSGGVNAEISQRLAPSVGGQEDTGSYEALVDDARRRDAAGDAEGALDMFLHALDANSSDASVHLRAVELGVALGMWPSQTPKA